MSGYPELEWTTTSDQIEDLPMLPTSRSDYFRMWVRRAWHLTPRHHGRTMVKYTVWSDQHHMYADSYRCRRAGCRTVRY